MTLARAWFALNVVLCAGCKRTPPPMAVENAWVVKAPSPGLVEPKPTKIPLLYFSVGTVLTPKNKLGPLEWRIEGPTGTDARSGEAWEVALAAISPRLWGFRSDTEDAQVPTAKALCESVPPFPSCEARLHRLRTRSGTFIGYTPFEPEGSLLLHASPSGVHHTIVLGLLKAELGQLAHQEVLFVTRSFSMSPSETFNKLSVHIVDDSLTLAGEIDLNAYDSRAVVVGQRIGTAHFYEDRIEFVGEHREVETDTGMVRASRPIHERHFLRGQTLVAERD